MEWWIWLVAGFLLLVAELFTPSGFVLFIFGLSAILMGLLGLAGLDLSSNTQLITYAILAVALLLGIRKHLVNKLFAGSVNRSDELTGKEVTVVDQIPVQGVGSCELRGTVWKAKNISESALSKGEHALVASIDGLTLSLVKKK